MDTQAIRKQINAQLGIAELNSMQEAVADAPEGNLILVAPTGSGKTIAFAISILRDVNFRKAKAPSVLVLAPARELVMQTYDVLRRLCHGVATVTAVYGGNSFQAEEGTLGANTPDILVATPGRLLDHIKRGTLDLGGIQQLVIDEYDKTLELGFQDELERICRKLPKKRRTVLTSATVPEQLPEFVHMNNATTIDVNAQLRLTIMDVPSPVRDKLDTLAALLRSIAREKRVMVFVNHRESAERVAEGLRSRKIDAALYHGGLEQMQREQAVAKFSSDAAPVLVATDLAARGLDIPDVGAVVHYHMPVDKAAYTHRNGRTARAGASGEVYVITGPDESVPDFVVTSHSYYPDALAETPLRGRMTLLHIGAGKRDKISRGDIAGFVMKQAGVPHDAVGRITLGLSYALVAVEPQYAAQVIDAARTNKLKNKRVRISTL